MAASNVSVRVELSNIGCLSVVKAHYDNASKVFVMASLIVICFSKMNFEYKT